MADCCFVPSGMLELGRWFSRVWNRRGDSERQQSGWRVGGSQRSSMSSLVGRRGLSESGIGVGGLGMRFGDVEFGQR